MSHLRITDDLDALLAVLPADIRHAVEQADDSDNLLEVILDLGRVPTARFVDREVVLREREVTREEIEYVDARVGEFDADNRAGIERTLHRISAIRNRRGHIVGLTLRVGRAVYGTSDIIEDIITSGKSILLLGRPGVGKTTLLREAARILAETRRVIIVDTSNEIGGDGDVPHPAIGKARRMQVREPMLQHEVMIEAVENHNPEVIVIDEIGRELEAAAARTIAERGVQLIGTAHGNTLENLLLNPTLSDLVGGIEAVTLSDEEARRRGTQKTVLERRAPPTFDVLIEIQNRDRLAIHMDVATAVDALLRGRPIPPEIRIREPDGRIRIERSVLQPAEPQESPGRSPLPIESASAFPAGSAALAPIRIYPYGVARNRLMQAAKRLGVPAILVRSAEEAQALVTLRTYYRTHQHTILEAEERGVPIYVLRSNTVNQIEQFLTDLFHLPSDELPAHEMEAIRQQTEQAIQTVLNGERWVDLPPAPAFVRRLQHEMARQADLVSHSYGKEPRRHVRIFRG
uniref:Single-stranded nucleic acid binding R3H n=1 Tax=uncultured Chloroflexota bacterium TaxID=166587 RepID=H5SEQ6_9CHLR|nr:single-stranded nucleic acid binding R3H [uncultured Chloroflexota bacterium]